MAPLIPWTSEIFVLFPWSMPMALLFSALAMIAAGWDVATYRIPNWLNIAIAALFVAVALAAPGPVDWLDHLGAGLAAFALGVALFALRVFGGGDAKLLGALGLWIGLQPLPAFLVTTALAGGVFALGLIVARRGMQMLSVTPVLCRLPGLHILAEGKPVPYGVAIAAGAILVEPYMAVLYAYI